MTRPRERYERGLRTRRDVMNCLVKAALILTIFSAASGQSSVYRCYNELFDSTLCNVGSVIQVISSQFGVSDCAIPATCCPSQSDCTVDIKDKKPEYYARIVASCEGYRECQDLVADWGDIQGYCGLYKEPNYVIITYSCIPETGGTELPVTPPVTTPSGERNGTTASDGISPSGSFNPAGMLAGIAFAGLLVAIIVLVGLYILRRRRKEAEAREAGKDAEAPSTQQREAVEEDDNGGYSDDDCSWDEGEDWDSDDVTDGEGPPGRAPSRRTTRKKSRKSRRNPRTTDTEEDYNNGEPIYDDIDINQISGTSNEEKDDVNTDSPNHSDPHYVHVIEREAEGPRRPSGLLDQRTLLSLPDAAHLRHESKIMVQNVIYDSGFAQDASEDTVTDDIYLEPVQSMGDDDSVVYSNSPYIGRSPPHLMEPSSGEPDCKPDATGQGKRPYESLKPDAETTQNRDRTGTNASDMYWCLEPPEQSTA